MLIGDRAKTKWNPSNKKFYEEKGYVFTKFGDEFYPMIKDLGKWSLALVEFNCDYCNGVNQTKKEKKYRDYVEVKENGNKDCCSHPDCIRKRKIDSFAKKKPSKENSLLENYPDLIKEWSPNNQRHPSEFSYGSRKSALWLCPKCNSEYDMMIQRRALRNNGCPYCVGTRVNHTNSFASKNTELIKEWDYKKNQDINPQEVTSGSNKRVWWISECGHEWKESINARTKPNGLKCPYCFGRKVNDENSLLAMFPQLVEEIHPTKNKNFDPNKVKYNSIKLLWWICKNGHEYEYRIHDRTQSGINCPYCSNQRAYEDNCLATVYPKLAEEWDYEKNYLTPNEVTAHSSKKVWWKCKTCGHSWKRTVEGRSSAGRNCPVCKESKGERKVREYLSLLNLKFTSQIEFKGLNGIGGNPLRFDFAIFDECNKLKLLIEYDGEFHYKKIYGEDGHEMIVQHDKLKDTHCKKNNIPLLRIPYWEFDDIETKLYNKLKELEII